MSDDRGIETSLGAPVLGAADVGISEPPSAGGARTASTFWPLVMLRRLYEWVMRLAEGPQAMRGMAAVSFAESSFFPIPPDVMLIPMVIARPDRAWRIAFVCTVASVLGGFFGYAIGYFLFETVGQAIVNFYGLQAEFVQFEKMFEDYGMWVVAVAGFTPFPYKIATIASGVAHFDLLVFGLTSFLTRGGRFFLVAGLLKVFGPSIRHFIDRYLPWVATAFMVLLIGGFYVLTLL
jgi:membrane protein YqaA with SNARE-associated domain